MTTQPNQVEQKYLDELLSAMRGPCKTTFPHASPLMSPNFAEEFKATLLIHHYFLKAPLATNSFEAAFVRAAQAAGHKVSPAPDGQRFWDVEIDGRKVSLKSTAAKDLRVGTLHISKLCEAAWIQDMRSAANREEATKQLFAGYTDTVDSIVQLRLFKKKAFYELVEIPTHILAQVAQVPRSAFASDGPSIDIPIGAETPDFTLKLDRSDAKVTLARINKDVCSVLGTWQLEKDAEVIIED
jgi:hypothetical protein